MRLNVAVGQSIVLSSAKSWRVLCWNVSDRAVWSSLKMPGGSSTGGRQSVPSFDVWQTLLGRAEQSTASAVGRHHMMKRLHFFTLKSPSSVWWCYGGGAPCRPVTVGGVKRDALFWKGETVSGRDGSLIVLQSWIIQLIWDNWSSVRSSVSSSCLWTEGGLDSDMSGRYHPAFLWARSVGHF